MEKSSNKVVINFFFNKGDLKRRKTERVFSYKLETSKNFDRQKTKFSKVLVRS